MKANINSISNWNEINVLQLQCKILKYKKKVHSIQKKTAKREAIILQLNQKIIGWSNYFRSGTSAKIFYYLDHHLFNLLLSRLKQIRRKRGYEMDCSTLF